MIPELAKLQFFSQPFKINKNHILLQKPNERKPAFWFL